ncbi:MAG TPA: DMT family transporter [Beutenbergiaceae bacterium]|nr:DMT family transporter [Beutenbergiaceae bacterium]
MRRRRDRWLVAVLGVVWMGVPFMLLTIAQQHIPSALAGMINGAAPWFTAAIAALWFKQAPGLPLLAGLGVGFAGVLAIGLPNVEGTASLFGVLLAPAATALYGVAFNLSGVLQSRNGPLPVIWRAQLVALAVVAPFGVPGLVESTQSPRSVLAMVALGALGTGLAFVLFTGLVGRVGAPRAEIEAAVDAPARSDRPRSRRRRPDETAMGRSTVI